MIPILRGGAAGFRNHYFTISWNTFGVGDDNVRFYKYRGLPGIILTQLLSNGFITIKSLRQALHVEPKELGVYLGRFNFYSQLMLIDPSLPKFGYVYLIIFENTFKIGKTENFERRYDSQTRLNLLKLTPVTNHDNVERELIQAYRDAGYIVDHGNEYFRLDNVHHVQTIYERVLSHNEVISYRSQWRDSRLVQDYRMGTSNTEISMDPKACMIIVNKFAKTEDQRRKFNQFLDLISKQISNGYFDQIYDNQNQSVCSYWQYFNFVAIRRWKDDKINVSRLFNSIRKNVSHFNQRPVRDIVERIVENKKIKEAFERQCPGKTMMEYCENKEQPYLSGYYLDVILVPTFVSRASTEVSLSINQLLLYLGSDAFVGSSVDEAKTNLQLHKFLSDRNLIHHEISYGLNDDS